jgi:hypothetical protein
MRTILVENTEILLLDLILKCLALELCTGRSLVKGIRKDENAGLFREQWCR